MKSLGSRSERNSVVGGTATLLKALPIFLFRKYRHFSLSLPKHIASYGTKNSISFASRSHFTRVIFPLLLQFYSLLWSQARRLFAMHFSISFSSCSHYSVSGLHFNCRYASILLAVCTNCILVLCVRLFVRVCVEEEQCTVK